MCSRNATFEVDAGLFFDLARNCEGMSQKDPADGEEIGSSLRLEGLVPCRP